MSEESQKTAALDYHRLPVPGKLAVVPTKHMVNQHDLALAYSPGVAHACEAIVADPLAAAELTSRANLVGVVTNGSAVLGLGAIGPLASKPVMEGKAVLFKKFAGIDVFDIELSETDPDRLVEIIAAMEPTFGGINLEDIKAPECFYVEEKLRERLKIPVFHDDQHGTAIVVAAAILNGLEVVGKKLEEVKLVCSGAGAAALACLDLLLALGLPREQIWVSDIAGVVYKGRNELMDPRKARYAQDTRARRLEDVITEADVFLGLSAGGVLKPAMVKTMARDPLILALANPTPEILPEEAREVRSDVIMATGRSDYPNQVNNVLCFPFIFRGALDVGATTVNEEMKLAAVHAIARLARAEASDVVASAYDNQKLTFGPEYLIPKPLDPRLILEVAPAVARAAMESGVAVRPLPNLRTYRDQLHRFAFKSGMVMRPLYERAKEAPKRIVYAEGEEERVLRAVQVVLDEGLARPILVGRREVVEMRLEQYGLRLRIDEDFELMDPQQDPRFRTYWSEYHRIMRRNGVSPARAQTVVRGRNTVIGALAVRLGDADGLICGIVGRYPGHLGHVMDVLGLKPGVSGPAALSAAVTPDGVIFFCDTHVNEDPDADKIAEMTLLAAEEVRRFGITPKVALLSYSNFGTRPGYVSTKMREALAMIWERAPELEADGEMQADTALVEEMRAALLPDSHLTGAANLLVMPNLEAANIGYNLVKAMGTNVAIGPLLLGPNKPAHILTASASVRRIVNMTAIATVDAQLQEQDADH